MKPSVFVILLVCAQALFSQQIDKKLLSTVAEIRKTNCDSALSLLPSNDIESLTNQELKAQAFLELGYTHYCLGNFNLVLENYQSSLDLFITINSKSKPAEILNLIGTLQKKQGDFC